MSDPETNTPPPAGSQNKDFKVKPVETPLLDSQVRQKLSATFSASDGSPSGSGAFYAANRVYVWGIVIGIVIISFLAFLLLHKPAAKPTAQANIDLSIDAPQTVASGGEVVYKITINNKDSQKLVKLQLELAYPDGAAYEDSTPKADNLSGSVFTVPDLISGQNATVFVKTRISGSINDSKTLDAKLHYSYGNFNSEFIKDQTSTVRLVASDVVLQLSGPPAANNAQLIVYTLQYQNNSANDIAAARVRLLYPNGFVFASAQPPPDLGSDTWNIGTLAKGGSGTITVQGSFSSVTPGESKTAQAQFLTLGSSGDYFTQAQANFVTAIASTPLLVTQSLEQQPADSVVHPGDTLRFNVRYQNNSNVVASAVNVVVTLESSALDLSTLQAQGGQVNNDSIIWNASSISNLANVAPNESGTLSFSVNVKDPATRDSSKNLTIKSHVKIKSDQYPDYFPGSDMNLKIFSPSAVTAQLNFSSGQLPPQTGKPTTYRVNLVLTNTTNDFANTVVSCFIPLTAGGLDQGSISDSANTTFDPATGKLVWNAGSLPAHTGQFTAPKSLQFKVTLSPSSSQVGQSPTLVKGIAMDAKDLFTGQSVHNETDDVTTRNINGGDNTQNGVVTR